MYFCIIKMFFRRGNYQQITGGFIEGKFCKEVWTSNHVDLESLKIFLMSNLCGYFQINLNLIQSQRNVFLSTT